MLIVFVVAGLLFWALYKFWVSGYKTWELRGVPFLAGSFPFGTDLNLSLLNRFQGESMDKMYKKAAPSPYFGIYMMRLPILVVRDPEIIRLVLTKDFSHFRDRMGFKIPKNDYLSHHLFNLEGSRWRALRVKLSPTFTSGKLKGMFHHFVECSEALENLLLSQINTSTNVKDITSRFTTDVICSCAFGLGVNSMENSDVELRKIGTQVFTLKPETLFKLLVLRSFPSMLEFTPFRLTPKSVEHYILKLIKDTVEYRQKNGVKRQDFLDLLIELKEKGKLSVHEHEEETGEIETDQNVQTVELTNELMAAQCFVFFLAGFETSSSVQSYCLYELALNPDIQDRLFKEIEMTITKNGGLTYQAVQEMEYLDMVIHETLRKYPTLPLITRRCTEQFSMPAGNKVEVGDRIFIPTWSLHRDPEYFPNPEKFDPERFTPENKKTIRPYSYLPFGEGPRNCIGMRFGLLQTKIGIITVLRKFQVSPSEKTQIPLKFIGSTVTTTTEGPITLKITKRTA